MILVPGALPGEGAHHEAGWLAVEVLGVVAASVLPEPSHRYRGLIGDRGAGKDMCLHPSTHPWLGRQTRVQSSSQASLSMTSAGTKIEMQRQSGDTTCDAAGGRTARYTDTGM